jgi:hypothetical protein
MIKKKVYSMIFASVILTVLATSNVFACACCAEPGLYSVLSTKPDSYMLGLLEEMQFGERAELYTDAAGFEAIKGLGDLEIDSGAGKNTDLSIVEVFLNRAWRLNISTGGGRKGTLTLPIPLKMTKFKVDIHDTPEDRETLLYKEFRFSGRVSSGTGLLRMANTKPVSYTLIFQGRGNGCDNASDFTHWRLELSGPKVDFSLYGKLTPEM